MADEDTNENTGVISAVDRDEEEPDVAYEPEQAPDDEVLLEADESLEVVDNPIQFTNDVAAVASFKDHFTLQIPSSTVRYRERHSAARVLEGANSQFVLEESYDTKSKKHVISIRKIHNTSEGVRVLRLTYALVTAFFTGFLFIFCLQVLLFLVLDLALESGKTTHQEANWGNAVGAMLGFPALVYGFSSALVLAGSYVSDTLRGHYLIRNFTFRDFDPVTVEWLFFASFLGLPVLVMSLTLLSGTDDWWSISLLFWFACVLAFYVFFCTHVVLYELRACWALIQKHNPDDNDGFFHVLARCILSRQTATYSGLKRVTYLARGSIEDSEFTDKGAEQSEQNSNQISESYQEKISPLAKLTLWEKLSTDGGWGLYEHLEGADEQRVYSVDDARDVRPYVTSHTWSLEKIFCRRAGSRNVAIVKGPGAVTQSQLRSSAVCSLLGTALMYFFLFALLLYLGLGIVFTMFIVAVGVIIAWPTFKSTYQLYKLGNDLIRFDLLGEQGEAEDPTEVSSDEDKASEAVYLVTEKYRVTRPTKCFCWIMFILEVGIFFVYPFSSLFGVGNYPLALLFIVVAGISGIRFYINVSIVLEERGSLDLIGGDSERSVWKEQSRLNEIVGNITRGRSRGAWMSVLGAFGFVIVGIFLGAVGTETEDQATWDEPYQYTNDFQYLQKESLRYPTCTLTAGASDDGPLTTMADFVYLAGLAYRGGGDITQSELNNWFGGLNATAESEVVEDWKQTNKDSEVSFKMISFPTDSGKKFAYVTIRGTSNSWDMLTDAQLWSAAFLMQGLREILPIGRMWTPVIDQLINVMTTLESESIARVSFYRDTTRFVKSLKEKVDAGEYAGVAVTGHSLGGGLAMITGAQTGTPAVALSGPNAMLSRRTFDPSVSSEALDKFTFNIIPERDVVPMIDLPAQSWQSIRCKTDLTDVIGCHDSTRSLCEIIYTCGSGDRPVLCDCVTTFGYPKPTPKNGVTLSFDDVCEN